MAADRSLSVLVERRAVLVRLCTNNDDDISAHVAEIDDIDTKLAAMPAENLGDILLKVRVCADCHDRGCGDWELSGWHLLSSITRDLRRSWSRLRVPSASLDDSAALCEIFTGLQGIVDRLGAEQDRENAALKRCHEEYEERVRLQSEGRR